MSDAHWVADTLRILIATGALWLGVLVTKLAWTRYRNRSWEDPETKVHWATYASYAIALFAIGGYRVAALGQPPEPRLWTSLIIVGLGLFGVLRRVKVGIRRKQH